MPRHNNFTNREMRDMLCVYVQENYSCLAAARRYREMYPNRVHPNRKTFSNIFIRLGDTGQFKVKSDVGRPKNLTVDQEDILVRIADNPELSTRRLSAITGVSHSSVFRLLKKEHLRPYHFTSVQNLLPTDYPLRLNFAQWMLNRKNENRNFIKNILFTDEATFTRRGVFNWRNSHSWDIENPHLFRKSHIQHEFKINVWCGVFGDSLLGPYELPANLNGNSYLEFLQTTLFDELEELPLNRRRGMWFMQDGAPPHYPLIVRNYLDQQFPHRWIGRGSEFPWPPRTPECNPLNFYF